MIFKFSEFIKENVNRSKSIVKKKLEDVDKIHKFLDSHGKIGYLGKFTEFLFKGVSYDEMIDIYTKIIDLKSKNININVDSFESYEKLIDEIIAKYIDYKSKNILNQFTKEIKDILKSTEDNAGSNNNYYVDHHKKILSQLYDCGNIKPLMDKISRYKDYYSLTGAIERYIKSHSKPQDREYIKNNLVKGLTVVFENEDILIIKTDTHESIVSIGSDTSWCIVASESTFNSYTRNGSTQYVLFDYTKDVIDEYFKIGFTLDKYNKVTYSHNVLDHSCVSTLNEILVKNKVDVDSFNKVEKLTISSLNTRLKLEEYIYNYKFKEGDILELSNQIFEVMISSLSEKGRVRYNDDHYIYLLKRAIKSYCREFGPITEDKYNEIVSRFEEPFVVKVKVVDLSSKMEKMKQSIINNRYIIPFTGKIFPHGNREMSYDLKYYKEWEETPEWCKELTMNSLISILNNNKDIEYYKDILHMLYYFSNEIEDELAVQYLTYKVDGEFDEDFVKSNCNNSRQILNMFNIKYDFDPNQSGQVLELLNSTDVTLHSIPPPSFANNKLLPNLNVNIELKRDEFIKKVRGYYLWRDKKVQSRATANKYYMGLYNYVIGDINKLGAIVNKDRILEWSPNAKFPICGKIPLTLSNSNSIEVDYKII